MMTVGNIETFRKLLHLMTTAALERLEERHCDAEMLAAIREELERRASTSTGAAAECGA